MAIGRYSKVRGKAGNALFIVARDEDGEITAAWAGIVGKDGIKPDVFYTIGADGKPIEVT